MPVAIVANTGEIALLQMDGHLTREEFERALEMAIDGCKRIYKLQREALLAKYGGLENER